jgi:cobalamin biosynthetic protein CobC
MDENTPLNDHVLVHGGQLADIAKRYNIEADQWLDLSTGIAPFSYPVGILPAACWQHLPQNNEALLGAGRDYYQTSNLLATAGSQSIIQILPQLCRQRGFEQARVWLPTVGYQEHRKAWKNANFSTLDYLESPDPKLFKQGDIVLLINPNNPSGKLHNKAQLTNLLVEVSAQNGLLIIDEAFMDATPEHSMVPMPGIKNEAANSHNSKDRLIILRSVGKFFGLAGIRLGFVIASDDWLRPIAQTLGPWSVSGPAQYVGLQALTDTRWQQEQRSVLVRLSNALNTLLTRVFTHPVRGSSLFKTVLTPHAPALFDVLCQQGIYVRLCDEKNALRFGIPHEQGLLRLTYALQTQAIKRLL